MNDIACSVGISKRTLYEYFEDKEDILLQGIDHVQGYLHDFLDKIEKEEHSALEIIFLLHDELMKSPRWYDPKFYEDVKRYPYAQEKIESGKASFDFRFRTYFSQGVAEGDFQPEVNIEIMALLAKKQISMMQPSQEFSKHSTKEVYDTVMMTFLRGICTEKGRTKLERYIMKQNLTTSSAK